MSLLYIAAGINHFINPEFYKKIMPHWLPLHYELIYISGFLEILFAILLIPGRTRKYGAWGIILLLLAVFPANLQMLFNYYKSDHPALWIAIVRLPIQILLIWWASIFVKRQSKG